MLKQTLITSTLVAILSLSLMAQGHGHGKRNHDNANQEQSSSHGNRGELLNSIEIGELTDAQKDGLSFIIEEEKVARDVYLALGKSWNERVFKNIAKAEQKHMDALITLFSQYDMETPTTIEDEGVFENEELQKLYDDLVQRGNISLLDALEVGVLVEETDIADLEELLEAGVPTDFERTYNNLLRGSNKHLSTFNREISRQ
jgi:hypothetical protein